MAACPFNGGGSGIGSPSCIRRHDQQGVGFLRSASWLVDDGGETSCMVTAGISSVEYITRWGLRLSSTGP